MSTTTFKKLSPREVISVGVISKEVLSIAGIAASGILLALKLWAGIASGSIAVLSDALNSCLDLFSYGVIVASVRIQHKAPDKDHQFGHYRAEPLAGFVVSVVACLLGASIVKDAATSLFEGARVDPSGIPLAVLSASILVKAFMALIYARYGRIHRSPALVAAATDSRNDVLASATAMVGFIAKGNWDGVAGILIGLWILYSGIKMGIENSGYLLGNSPGDEHTERIRRLALSIEGVSAVNDIRSHFVGNYIHVEVHIELPADMALSAAHDIGEEVRQKIGEDDDVGFVFVHLDVFGDPTRLRIV